MQPFIIEQKDKNEVYLVLDKVINLYLVANIKTKHFKVLTAEELLGYKYVTLAKATLKKKPETLKEKLGSKI